MLVLFTILIGFGHADPFDRVLAFGASVTHGTAARVPGYELGVRAVERWGAWRGRYARSPGVPRRARPYGESPVIEFVRQMAGESSAARIKFISRWRTYSPEDLGSAQCRAMLSGKSKSVYDRASMVIGLDAFYWDAIWNTCGPGLDELISDFIADAREAGRPLMLGTVPIEDAASVRIDSERLGVPLWFPPRPACAARINDLLRRACRPEAGCFVVDLERMVARLNAGERLRLKDGREIGLYEARPDGVHLSDVGSLLATEMMINATRGQLHEYQ